MLLVITGIVSATLMLATSLPVAFAWIFSYDVPVTLTWLLFPSCSSTGLAVTVVTGTLLAGLYSRWRDTAIVWGLMGRILFLTSGVVFPFEVIKGELFQTLAAFNPLCPGFVTARKWMIDPAAPNWADASGSTLGILGAVYRPRPEARRRGADLQALHAPRRGDDLAAPAPGPPFPGTNAGQATQEVAQPPCVSGAPARRAGRPDLARAAVTSSCRARTRARPGIRPRRP